MREALALKVGILYLEVWFLRTSRPCAERRQRLRGPMVLALGNWLTGTTVARRLTRRATPFCWARRVMCGL